MFRAFQDYLLGWGPVISQCTNLTFICLVSVSQLPKICHVLCLHCILGGSIKKPICFDSEWSTPKPDIYSDLLLSALHILVRVQAQQCASFWKSLITTKLFLNYVKLDKCGGKNKGQRKILNFWSKWIIHICFQQQNPAFYGGLFLQCHSLLADLNLQLLNFLATCAWRK